MSMPKSVIAAIAAAAVLLLSAPLAVHAQTTAKDVGQKMADTGEAIKDYTVDKKNEAVAHAKKLGRDIDAKIKKLDAQASKQAGEAKAKSKDMIKDLKAKRAVVSSKLNDMSKATKASWDDTKKAFGDAWQDLATSYDKAVAEFKK
jgi:Spy/CpxP family protein refolding chaperone